MLWIFLFIRLTRTNYNPGGISRNRLCTVGYLWQEHGVWQYRYGEKEKHSVL